MSQKVSIRFFNNREVRAAWDDSTNQWLFSIADIVGLLNGLLTATIPLTEKAAQRLTPFLKADCLQVWNRAA